MFFINIYIYLGFINAQKIIKYSATYKIFSEKEHQIHKRLFCPFSCSWFVTLCDAGHKLNYCATTVTTKLVGGHHFILVVKIS